MANHNEADEMAGQLFKVILIGAIIFILVVIFFII